MSSIPAPSWPRRLRSEDRARPPPVRHPCFYGVDMATKAELIASGWTIAQICQSLGADSLQSLSLEALVSASMRPADSLCRACFDGRYPITVPHATPTDDQTTLPVLAAHGS